MSAFKPLGNTTCISVTVTASTGVQVGVPSAMANCYMLVNTGTVPVFIGTDTTAALALVDAVIPVVGTPSGAYCIPPNIPVYIDDDVADFFSVICSATASLYITPGRLV